MNHDKATPRPWRVDRPEYSNGYAYVKDENSQEVATCYSNDETGAAALICAAVNAWDDPAALRERLKELGAVPPLPDDVREAIRVSFKGMPTKEDVEAFGKHLYCLACHVTKEANHA